MAGGTPSAYDLTGQRFGRLVAVERVANDPTTGAARWRTRCDCGGETVSRANSLVKGRATSCGCLRIEKFRASASRRAMASVTGLTGRTFGRLTVLGPGPKFPGERHAAFRCSCSCGNETVVRGYSLRQGKARSCGCLVGETVAETNRRRRKNHNVKETA